MKQNQDLSDYRALLEKVSAKFQEIYLRHKGQMNCGKGCSSCCAPDLTVFAVERENIYRYINSQPGLGEKLKALEAADPHQGTRCRFLSADGQCEIYEVRPIVCRSHGAPIYFKTEDGAQADACPLNFKDGMMSLQNDDFINVDLLNQLLALINQRFDPNTKGERYPLAWKPDGSSSS